MKDNCDQKLTGNKNPTENVVEIEEVEDNDLILLQKLIENEKQMSCINNNDNYNKLTGNKNSTENVVEVKEVENNDIILLQKLIENEKQMRWINDNDKNIPYENFKLMNEEIDIKLECNGDDADQLTERYEREDISQTISSCDLHINSASKEEEINNLKEVKKNNYVECEGDGITKNIKTFDVCCSEDSMRSNKLIHDFASNIENNHLKSIFNAKNLIVKLNFNDHYLLKMCSDTSKISKCNNSNNKISTKKVVLQPKLKDGMKNISNLISYVKSHRNIKNFKCTFCSKGYVHDKDLSDHLLKIHKYKDVKRKLYNCDRCNYKTYVNHYLNQHVRIHKKLNQHVKIQKNIKTLKCSYCSKKYITKRNLNNHLLAIHKGRDVTKELYKCDECSYETYTKHLIKKHTTYHKNIKNFSCSYCSISYNTKAHLNDHLLRIHNCRNLKKIYNCNQCSYKTYYKAYLNQHANRKSHLLAIHKDRDVTKIRYKCEQCSYETYIKHLMIQHTTIHKNIKHFSCSYCSISYNTKAHLNDHLLRIHNCRNLKKIYNCKQCSYKTYYKAYLNQHANRKSHLLAIHKGRDVTKKLYKCDQCSYETYIKHLMIQHTTIHKNIKNFICSYCAKIYNTKINLNDHLLRFHNCRNLKKIYKCNQCSYETYTKSYLSQHANRKSHHNTKKFKRLHG